jgi:hypothetical protein
VVPAVAVALGFVLAAAGLVYDLAFAGLPYQDPTPEMQARWRYHSGVASVIELVGGGVVLLGVAGLAAVGVWSLTTRRAEPGAAPDRGRM